MVHKIKNHSTAKRTALLWMIFLSPVVGLVTYMVATHNGLDYIATAKLSAAAVAAWWLGSYVFIRALRWRGRRHAGPSSLPPA